MAVKCKRWSRAVSAPRARTTMEAAGVSPLTALTLCACGLSTPEKASAFLDVGQGRLLDPLLVKGMGRVAAWVCRALAAGERIAVYSDYDVNDIISTCLFTGLLRREGGTMIPYIPDRMEEGYGPNRKAVAALRGQGVGLTITMDCGITTVKETACAASLGVEPVIADHHECKAALPAAVTIVDPHRVDCPYPSKCLAGVGVILKFVLVPGGSARQDELLERYANLAATGTVAGVVSLTGENHIIVRLELEVLRRTGRPGLRAPLHKAGLDERLLIATAIGHTLAPRINAFGWMECVSLAGELFLTNDPVRGEELSRVLCDLNRERQATEAEIYTECQVIAEARPWRRALVLAGEQWHQGVVDTVVSRLAEKYPCPAFMIYPQDGKGEGPCRSFAGFNLFVALERCTPLLEGFGGHTLTAGFTIREENIPTSTAAMSDYVCACTDGEEVTSTLGTSGELDNMGLLALKRVEGLEPLGFYGMGNPKPVFSLSSCLVPVVSEVGGRRHPKLKLVASGRSFDAIFFSVAAKEAGVGPGDRVDVALTPQVNECRGGRSVQLQLCDLRPVFTRAQAEWALYERFCRREPLIRQEVEALLPSREEFTTLWRYLKGRAGQAPLRATARRLTRNIARSTGQRETMIHALVCLEVFSERELIRLEHTTDHLHTVLYGVDGKVNLDDFCIMQKLRHILSNG